MNKKSRKVYQQTRISDAVADRAQVFVSCDGRKRLWFDPKRNRFFVLVG